MKFSENWVKTWVNYQLNTEQLAEQITMLGLEVDACDRVAGEFNKVVVGEVVSAEKHPDADKLKVTKVNIGGDSLLNIVCGASNCRAGLKVACAIDGANLPNNLVIKKTELRGQASEGMLCSYKELGIDIESSGIIELPDDAPVGVDLIEYLELNDHTIEIGLTPNRADCLSIKGIAREVAVANDLELIQPFKIKKNPVSIDQKVEIKLENGKACPRYLGRIIKNIDFNATTPNWMQEKLRRCGIRTIDPVVDITNYVLLELGQPMHAFDMSKVNMPIIVRNAKQDEKLELLDGKTVTLNPEILVIADQDKALAMAGIFGGKESGVSAQTKDIILEAAFFAPLSIIGKARSFGIQTDSSYRFERGVDYQLQYDAMERATSLVLEICGGQAGPICEQVSSQDLPIANQIILRKNKLTSLLGQEIENDKIMTILDKLGLSPKQEGDSWQVTTPSWRFDLSIEEDLIEEVARIYGYNNIEDQAPISKLIMNHKSEKDISLNQIKNILVNRGYQEAITYSFVNPDLQKEFYPNHKTLKLQNPISVEMSEMRLSIVQGLLETVVYNQNRQNNQLKLFESGLRFIPNAEHEFGLNQEMVLAGVISGYKQGPTWYQKEKLVDFFDLKGDLEAVFDITIAKSNLEYQAQTDYKFLHLGQSAKIFYEKQEIGFIGVIHPLLAEKMELQSSTVIFEICLSNIMKKELPKIQAISKFPANKRDIAIIVNDKVIAQQILATCKDSAGPLLQEINIFDIYKGEGIPEGHKSMAINFIIQDHNKTLTEDEITGILNKIILSLTENYNAILRD